MKAVAVRSIVGHGRRLFLLVVAVLAMGAASVVAPGGSAAFAQTAGTDGVFVSHNSAGYGEFKVYGTQTKFMSQGIISVGLLYPASTAYEAYGMSSAELSHFQSACSGLKPGAQTKLDAAVTAMLGDPDAQLLAMKEHWQANTVRFHVSEGALAYEAANPGDDGYTNAVASVIQQARAMGLVVIISMDTEPFSCTSPGPDYISLPTAATETAWTQLLTALGNEGLGDNRGIMLEVLNEPRSDVACGGALDWGHWANGCTNGAATYLGMATVATWLRSQAQAQDNVIVLDADNGGGQFTGFTASNFSIPPNTAFGIHPFYYTDATLSPLDTHNWFNRFAQLAAPVTANPAGQGLAVIADAWNEYANGCTANQGLANYLVQTYLPEYNIGLTMEGWDAPTESLAALPLSTTGSGVADPVDQLPATCNGVPTEVPTGASLMYDQFWGNTAAATPAVQVSSLSWSGSVVNGVNLALADNGSPCCTQPPPQGPEVVSSVNVLVQKGIQTPKWVGTMTLASCAGPWWDNGSFTPASITGLATDTPTAAVGDTLIFRVRYQGVSGAFDTDYQIPATASAAPPGSSCPS